MTNLADELRHVAFPKARGDVPKLWARVADFVEMIIERERDVVLRSVVTTLHEVGEHGAAKIVREIRAGFKRVSDDGRC